MNVLIELLYVKNFKCTRQKNSIWSFSEAGISNKNETEENQEAQFYISDLFSSNDEQDEGGPNITFQYTCVLNNS